MPDLKLLALDSEDLDVVSAHVQDAVVRVGDMGYAKADRRFVLLMNRYVWEASDNRGRGERRRAGLHFDYVTNAHADGIDLKQKDGVLELLAVGFEMTAEPGAQSMLELFLFLIKSKR